ncbi:MAG: hypothetical protein RLZZ500_2164 [Bacteroidota bacterium]|jgi:hypothetical protein
MKVVTLHKMRIMKRILLAVVLLLTGIVSAQTGPKIVFKDKDNTVDYGTVTKETDSGERVFEFTNTGDQPLIIKNVQSTCGCTVPSKPEQPIMPGKTGEIKVKYNMNPGPIRKTITVETNAINVEGGMVALKIKGEVIVKNEPNPLEKKTNLLMNKS